MILLGGVGGISPIGTSCGTADPRNEEAGPPDVHAQLGRAVSRLGLLPTSPPRKGKKIINK